MDAKIIEEYINDLGKQEDEFKNNLKALIETKRNLKNRLSFLRVLFFSMKDYVHLLLLLYFKKEVMKKKNIVYTLKNFCIIDDQDQYFDRIIKPIHLKNVLFINYGKQYLIPKINNKKVYNIGSIVHILSKFISKTHSKKMRVFLAYRKINNSILKKLNGNKVYTLCYYDLNGLSLCFSKLRKNIELIEVQHGSIINYPPYVKPSPLKVIDTFYVKNNQTAVFLKEHLCLNFSTSYKLLPYEKGETVFKEGTYILYASTIEFNGFHDVFKSFLKSNTLRNLHVIVRLHPREKNKKDVFKSVLEAYKTTYEFDESKNWITGNKVRNLIVVSPWSSTIEDSYDNGFKTIIIDKVGEKRFQHLIDNKMCFYSSNLEKTILNTLND